ncbi:MAG: hypothetical protein PHU44_19550 [Syntrophales bacterium]|nr:hypothetical protein [Syntrophales bacterium]MDD5643235.1 hypothetical protein [Syntrophales bacterium]
MAIKNLVPRLAERGKIKIGERGEIRTSQQGKQFSQPKKLDHFVVSTMQRDAAGRLLPDLELMRKLSPQGGKLKELPVMLLYNDPDINFQTRYACYIGNRLWCCGNGEDAQRLEQDGKYQPVPCPCLRLEANYTGKDKCKPNGTLQVLLQGVDRIGGVWKFRTTSWNSVNSIMSSLKLIQAITGGVLAGIPLKLVLSPKTVTIPGTGQNMIVYVVSLEFSGTEQELAKIGYDIAKRRADHKAKMDLIEAEARKALEHLEETPEEMREVQEEFYPEGVTIEVQPEAAPESEAEPGEGPPAEPASEASPPATDEKPELIEETLPSPEPVSGEEQVPVSWDAPPVQPRPSPNPKANKSGKAPAPPRPTPPGEITEEGKPTLF